MLPIDTDALDPEDIGEKRATLQMDHRKAVEHVREAFADAGFGFPEEFSPSELLNEKVDANRDPYYVLGACNPEMADRALDASDGRIGALFPCNVVVWQEEPGVQTVYRRSRPSASGSSERRDASFVMTRDRRSLEPLDLEGEGRALR